ncbi:MAG: methionine synthase [Anaerolineales bacterium]
MTKLSKSPRPYTNRRYLDALAERVLIFDGAMGTSLQKQNLTAEHFGGERYVGCNDYLVLTYPQAVEKVHRSFLEAGVDVIETDTFRSNRITLREYGLQDRVLEINRAAARLARRLADEYSTPTPTPNPSPSGGGGWPRFVAGSIGPTGKLPSADDPDLSNVTFEELADVFREQAVGLIQGGADVLLIETSQDILEVKAAIHGILRAFEKTGEWLPIQAQVTLDTTGRMLFGTDIAAALTILEGLPIDVIGLNCSTGPEHMRQPVEFLGEHAPLPVSCIPNAGLPLNVDGEAVYPLEPEPFAEALAEFVEKYHISVVGGCCGTTPAHLKALVERVHGKRRPPRPVLDLPRLASGIRAFSMQQDPPPLLIGERCNAQGSRKFKRLLLAEDWDGVLEVARQQVDSGAHALDISVAVTERQDEAELMRLVVRKLVTAGIDVPLAFDTTDPDVMESGLQVAPGRCLLNSTHLESGREKADRVFALAKRYNAAVLLLTIDEQGMAKTAARKVEVARRLYDIAVNEHGLKPGDLVYDVLTFTLATGDEEYVNSAVETLEGIRQVKAALPGVFTSLGVSNVSFGLTPAARHVINSVFLYHAVKAGLDMAIVNPAQIRPYAEIPPEERELAEDLIFNRRPDALQRVIEYFEDKTSTADSGPADPTAGMSLAERLHWRIVHRQPGEIGDSPSVEADVDALVAEVAAAIPGVAPEGGRESSPIPGPSPEGGRESSLTPQSPLPKGEGTPDAHIPGTSQAGGGGRESSAAVHVLNNVLLPAMKEVGDKFGSGELILPFVLQSAEVMKRAVARLETYLERAEGTSKGRLVLATVYGDVHDIGKNLVKTILSNNGYEVIDLGKQVPAETILKAAEEHQADAIGLSALLVSTSKQMPLIVNELHRRGRQIPVLVGGAAINRRFGRRINLTEDGGRYPGGVFYCKDAFEGLETMDALQDSARRGAALDKLAAEVRHELGLDAKPASRGRSAARRPSSLQPAERIPQPPHWGARTVREIPLEAVFQHLSKNELFRLSWGAKNAHGAEWEQLQAEFEDRLQRMQREALREGWLRPQGVYGYWPCQSDGDDLLVYAPLPEEDGTGVREIIARFHFPRQEGGEGLCLADYFASVESGRVDVVALQVVTVGQRATERFDELQAAGQYSDAYYIHGLAVQTAEAAAEYLHRHVRRELGLPEGQGKRYSWGYPAIPELEDHRVVFDLLPAEQELGMSLTAAWQLVPEQSTAAIIVHHPAAAYFNVGTNRLEQLMADGR